MGCTSALENMLLLQENPVAMQGDKAGDTVNKTSHWKMWERLPGLLGQKKRCFVFHHFCSVCLVDLFLFHTRTKEGIDLVPGHTEANTLYWERTDTKQNNYFSGCLCDT